MTPRRPSWTILSEACRGFVRHDCAGMAAGLAFYTLLSLAPLLVVAVTVISGVVDPATVALHFERQAERLVGEAGAEQVRSILEAAANVRLGSRWASVAGAALTLAGATTVLVELQSALDRVWGVRTEPARATLRQFLVKRATSLALLAVVVLVLVGSLITSTVIAAASSWMGHVLPAVLRAPASAAVDLLVSLVVCSALFSATFKMLPDAEVRWRHVVGGGMATGALFVGGKSLLAAYLGSSALGSLYGAAGSLAVVLLWVYYTANLVLFGAELTRAWAQWLGERVQPAPFASEEA